MSVWNKFNAELKRRNALARQFEPSPEEEEVELKRRAKEVQNYMNASEAKAWAAKSPEEQTRILYKDYADSFFITTIDGKVYLQSGIDGALTDDAGRFIGYESGEVVEYRETPDNDAGVWDQNEYGQFTIANLMAVEDDIRQFEEEHPDMEWGQPLLSEDVRQKMNAALREREAEQESLKAEKALMKLVKKKASHLGGMRKRRTKRKRTSRRSKTLRSI
jgi:hypothetical protein